MQETLFVRCARCGALFVPHEDQAANLRVVALTCPFCPAVVNVELPDALPPS